MFNIVIMNVMLIDLLTNVENIIREHGLNVCFWT